MKNQLSKILTKGVFLVCLTALISCGTIGLTTKQNLISPGQSGDEVINILGTPGNKQFQGKDEAWQYCHTGFSSDLYVIVWLHDGKVTGMKTYNGYVSGPCAKGFRSIDWQDAPDRTVEYRVR